jgi:hypothetical protein
LANNRGDSQTCIRGRKCSGRLTSGRGGIVRPSVAFQHRHQHPPRSQLLNPVWGSQSNRSPPTDGRVDAGGASPASRSESAEYPWGDAVTRLGSGTKDAIRNLSSILERQVATVGASPQPERSPFDAFPPTTRQLVLFASQPMPDGTAPTRPITTFVEVLALSKVAFMQNHMHHFLRHSKHLDVQIASGVCTVLCTGTFTSGAMDRPGAFSLFCCGPQAIEAATSGGKETDEQTNSLIQMQLKTTDTTTGLSNKDIKNITKFFTFPQDFTSWRA